MEMFFVVNQDRTADKAAGFYEAQKTQNVYLAPFPSPDLGGGKVRFGLSDTGTRKVNTRLPGQGNSKSHGARPVHQIISMIKWIWTSRLSMKTSLRYRGCG